MKLLFFLLTFDLLSCGHILFWDFQLDYTNIGSTTQYTLSFSLETPLLPTDYLRLVFPYNLHTSVSSNIPNNIQAIYKTFSSDFCSSFTARNANIFYSSTPNGYYIQFLDDNAQSFGLQSQIAYSLTITLTTPVTGLTSGINANPIQLYTVSSSDINQVIYDSNPLFCTLGHTATPSSNIDGVLSVSDSTMHTLGSQYPIYLTVYPRDGAKGQSRIFLSLSNNNFMFTGGCSLESGLDSFGNSIIPNNMYSCSVDTVTNMVKMTVFSDLPSSLLIKAWVTNPIRIFSGVYVTIQVLTAFSNTILMQKTFSSYGLSTTALSLKASRLTLAWGLDYQQNMAPSQTLTLIRGDAATPTAFVYNSLRFYFSFISSFPDNVEFQLNFNLKTSDTASQGSYILEGSIVENLPGFNSNQPRCYVLNNDQNSLTNYRQIICDHVGRLQSNFDYFIGFRMFLAYDAVAAALPNDFSTLTIYTKTLTTLDTTPILSNVLLISSPIQTVNNHNWFILSLKNTVVTTQSSSQSTLIKPELSSSITLGLQYLSTNDPQRLVFHLVVPAAQSTSTAFPLSTDVPNTNSITDSAGLVIVMNPSIKFDTTVPIIENTMFDASYMSVKTIEASSQKTVVQVSGSQTIALQNCYANDNYNRFSLKNVVIPYSGSYYPDDMLLDFYFYSYDHILNPSPTYLSIFFANAYVISTPKPNYLYFSLVNYYNGASINNDGTYLPTILRVYGFLRNNDVLNKTCQRLAFFLDSGLSFYRNTADSFDRSISCASSIGNANCFGYDNTRVVTSVQDFVNFKRIEVDFSMSVPTETANSFQLLIPVKTTTNNFKVTLFMAALIYHTTIPNNRYYKPVCIYRLTGDASILNTNQMIDFTTPFSTNNIALSGTYSNGVSGMNYGWSSSDTLVVGSIKSSLSIYASHSETPTIITPNSNLPTTSGNGAGFTMNLAWDFTSSLLAFNWQHAGVNYAEKCLNYKYNRNSATPDWRYGVFCPFQSGVSVSSTSFLNISSFYVTNINGIQIPSYSCFGYSKNSGALVSLATLSGFTLTPGTASPGYFIVFPIKIKTFEKNVFLKWNMTFSNPLVTNMKITISFNSTIQFSPGSLCYFQDQNGFKDATCTASLSSSTSIQFLLSNCPSCPYPAGTYIIYHYGNTAPAVSFSSSIISSYVHQATSITTKLASGNLVDSTPANFASSASISYDYSMSSIANFSVSAQASFSYPQQGAMTNFSFVFGPNNRGIYASEAIVIDLGTFSTENSGNPLLDCGVYSAVDVRDNRFYSISMSSLSQIVLKAAVDIIQYDNNPRFLFHCENLRVPMMTQIDRNITVGLKDSSLNNFIQASMVVFCQNFSDTMQFGNQENVVLSKLWNYYLLKNEILFNVSVNITVTKDTLLFIGFPSYYLPELVSTNEYLFCQINGVTVNSAIFSTRKILISSFPNDIPALNSFLIRIQGVPSPNIYSNPQNFTLSFATNYTTLLKYGAVQDILSTPNTQLSNLIISNFSIASGKSNIRQNSQYSLVFSLPNYLIQENNTILLDLPFEWNFALRVSSKLNCSCLNYSASSSINLLKNCSSVNNQIQAYFGTNSSATNSDLSQSTYILTISGIYNPMELICKPNKFLMAIITNSSLSSYTAYSTLNIPQDFSFTLNFNLDYLQIQSPSFSGTEPKIDLPIGSISDEISFYINSSNNNPLNFEFPLQINLISSGFLTIPSDIFIPSGQSLVSFRVFNNSNMLPGVFPLQFAKTSDPFNQYGDLPLLLVNLKSFSAQFSVLTGSIYQIPRVNSGVSNLIIIDTGSYRSDNITLNAFIEDATLNISFYDGSYKNYILFNRNSSDLGIRSYAFLLKINGFNDSGISVQTRVIFNFSGSSLITPPDPITVYLTSDLTEIPNFLLDVPILSSESTNIDIIMNCDQNGVIYYGISTIDSLLEDISHIKQKAWNFTKYQYSQRDQKQYGFIIINDTNNGYNVTYTIGNLLSNTSYRILGFCVNQADIMSVSVMKSFSTKWNGGYVQKINFNYQTALNKTQIEGLICYLDYFFGISSQSIYSKEGIFCSNITRISSNFVSSFNQNSPNSSSLSLYFLPSLNSETDTVTNKIASLSSDMTFLYYSVQKYLSFLPTLQSLNYPQKVPSTIPFFDQNYDISLIYGNNTQTYITVKGLGLIQTGFIYLGLVMNNNGFNPSFDDLRICQDSRFLNCVMNLKNPKDEMIWNFTGLKNNTVYSVFYAASEENPGNFAKYVDVQVISVNTSFNATSDSRRNQEIILILIILIAIILINY